VRHFISNRHVLRNPLYYQAPEVPAAFMNQAKELIREKQQSLGHPIVSFQSYGYRMVAVGNTIHWSKDWKTFHDFLLYYIKKVMNGDWGNLEPAKKDNERNPILQWYVRVWRGAPRNLRDHALLGLLGFR